jgi:hypothetical protein
VGVDQREENQLFVIETKVLRTICGPKIENGVYRRRYNHELEREFDTPNVLNVTKTGRLRYAGHMNSDSLALGVRDWTLLKTSSHGKIFLHRP